ncbi:MAG: FAD-binding protein [Nitrospirae bacterium]|nr:FAD-binding protein [Nitrospirota bacterium]
METTDQLAGIEISTEKEELICYSYDSSIAEPELPRAVAWPRNTEQVIRLAKYASDHNISLIPRGAGTGMAGSSVPVATECMVISFEKMRKIIDINTKNMTVVVEPGILNSTLQQELKYLGFFYPPDPASLNISTIGGNVATNAGGPRAVKYGVTRDYVMEIEAVTADGTLINAGGRTYKRAVGYDLKNLLVGSEGTLALSTRIRLKILPLPQDVLTLLAIFKDLETAGQAVTKILSSNIAPRTMELMDRLSIEAVENYKSTGLPPEAEALLLIEFDGISSAVQQEAETVIELCRPFGGDIIVAEDDAARDRLWEARRSISPALYHIKPSKINEDIVVPRDKIAAILKDIKKLSEESGIKIISFGHAGDGNLHVNIMTDKNDPEEYRQGLAIVKKLFEITLNYKGSISGEHGIGITKAPYLEMEIKKRELELMKGIKKIFDPKGMLNPGKIFC